MRPSKITAVAILFGFALQLFGCSTTKLLRPEQRPEKLESKKITVVTTDQKAYTFSEIRAYGDTLYGVYGITFPNDRRDSDVISIPFSEVQSIRYRSHNTLLTITFIVAVVTVTLALSALAVSNAFGSGDSWGYSKTR